MVTYPLETLSVRYIVRSTTAKGLQRELESRYKRASWEIDDFAQKNKLLYGPINYEFVKYNHTSSESTSLVAWVPAVRDVNPLHIPQVRIMLSRPLNIIKDGIRIKEYGGEAV